MKKRELGTWITLSEPSITEIVTEFEFDWICIDLEHSVIDYNQMQILISIIQNKNKKAYVRVGENNAVIIKRALDAGADGIIIPMIRTIDDVKKAVNHTYYPPIGERGVGLARAQSYGLNFENYKNRINDDVKLVLQIEHIDAINILEEIISFDGVSGTFIGPYDLSGSMGKPGDYNDEDVQLVLKKYINIAKKYDKLIGIHVIEPNMVEVNNRFNEGYDFIALSSDILFFSSSIKKQFIK